MSYRILGRQVKNEHIVLTVVSLLGAGVFAATRGGDQKKQIPPASSSVLDKTVDKLKEVKEEVKEAVVKPAMSEEEEVLESIRKFIADAEKEDAKQV
ncbi:hypothetical protein D9758_010593 [Tetrapyrgos nigripes]|uniref:Uncharacterized protein n=1 Tax=Tetrapyrgos nigripes TaxID=182062 RepID=A0A8H5D7V4_9AGAR|nr:hypothetical protein D9758_010593 [Tetrapyrgos nigripes]